MRLDFLIGGPEAKMCYWTSITPISTRPLALCSNITINQFVLGLSGPLVVRGPGAVHHFARFGNPALIQVHLHAASINIDKFLWYESNTNLDICCGMWTVAPHISPSVHVVFWCREKIKSKKTNTKVKLNILICILP